MWRCKACGRAFANRNQTHTCGAHDLEHHLANKPPEIRALYDAFARAVRRCGRVTVLPEKTRVAFHVRMSFAQVTPRRKWLDGHLVLARRVENERFTRVETFSARNHLHAFRIRDVRELDEQFLAWIAESYAVGEQKHLDD